MRVISIFSNSQPYLPICWTISLRYLRCHPFLCLSFETPGTHWRCNRSVCLHQGGGLYALGDLWKKSLPFTPEHPLETISDVRQRERVGSVWLGPHLRTCDGAPTARCDLVKLRLKHYHSARKEVLNLAVNNSRRLRPDREHSQLWHSLTDLNTDVWESDPQEIL